MHLLQRASFAFFLITLAGCASSSEDVSAGSGQDLSSGSGAATAGALTATGMFVSEDGLGRMRLDATGSGDILVSIPQVNVDPKSSVFTGKLKTADGKTTFVDVNQADCSLTLVGNQDSIKIADETAACKIMDSDGLLLRTYVHEKADALKGDYARIQDDSSGSQEAITLSVLTSGDTGLTFSVSVAGNPSLTNKTATIVDSVDLVWKDGKPTGGCTLGIVLLAPNQIVLESEDNCVDDQGTPHSYLGRYTRAAH